MKQISYGFAWGLGAVLLLAAAIVLLSDPLSAVPPLTMALFTMPPTRMLLLSKLPGNIPPGAAAAPVGVLFICFLLSVTHVQSKRERAANAIIADVQRILEKEFTVNKPIILTAARGALKSRAYKKAVELTTPYISTKDADLFKVDVDARNSHFAFDAKEAKKKRAADEHEAKIARQFNPWDGSYKALEKAIKETMNDRDSYRPWNRNMATVATI